MSAEYPAIYDEAEDGFEEGAVSAEDVRIVREALEAAQHIAECAEHQNHLDDAEAKARAALPAHARLEARLARLELALDTIARGEYADFAENVARDALAATEEEAEE